MRNFTTKSLDITAMYVHFANGASDLAQGDSGYSSASARFPSVRGDIPWFCGRMSIIGTKFLIQNENCRRNRGYELPMKHLLPMNPSVYRGLNGQRGDNAYHTNGYFNDRSSGARSSQQYDR
jgi:hypothetical protein